MPDCPECHKSYTGSLTRCPHCGCDLSLLSDVLVSGTILQSRYEIDTLSQIGQTSYIYIARDKKLYDRLCVIKQIKAQFIANADLVTLKQAILRMAAMNIPNVAMLLDHFIVNEQYFVVVEYISGKPLTHLFKENNADFTEDNVMQWAVSICDIVSSIHRQGMIHSDIRPESIMLTDEGFIKFIDFGILQQLPIMSAKGHKHDTPANKQTDIRAIGSIISYLLGNTMSLHETRDSPTGLQTVIDKALQDDLKHGYSSVSDMAQELKDILKKGPVLNISNEQLTFDNIIPGRSDSKKITLINEGKGKLIGKTSTTQSWITLRPTSLEMEAERQEMIVIVNTAGLPAGYAGNGAVNVVTNGGRKSIDIIISISATPMSRAISWISGKRWLVFLLIALILVISATTVIYNSVFKTDPLIPSEQATLFMDDFSDPGSGWYSGLDATGEAKYEDGQYSLHITQDNYDVVARENDKIGMLSDFVVEIDAMFVSGPESTWYGIGFRQQDNKNSYDFLIDTGVAGRNASFSLLKQVDGKWFPLKDWTESDILNKDKEVNKLKIVCRGSSIEAYANDQRLLKVTDTSFPRGTLVLQAAKNGDIPATIVFDNIKIYVPD